MKDETDITNVAVSLLKMFKLIDKEENIQRCNDCVCVCGSCSPLRYGDKMSPQ